MASRLPLDIDIHTHNRRPDHEAVIAVDPSAGETIPADATRVSVGVHPWNAQRLLDDPDVEARLTAMLDDPRTVAIGEIGFDRARGPRLDVQEAAFARQAALAAQRGLPVVIHAVRANDIVLKHRRRQPDGQWIVHGYRGGEAAARQLLDAGIDLSFGARYNPAAYRATPPDRRYSETD